MLTCHGLSLLSRFPLRLHVTRDWFRCVSNVVTQLTNIADSAEAHQSHSNTIISSDVHPRNNRSSTEQVCPSVQRSLKAAIIGIPNAGKSTLLNQILGQKVFAVSPKRHTTLHRAVGVFTEGNTQVVLLDTPGLIPYKEGRKLRVTKQFLTDPSRSLMEADLVVVMVDVSNKRTRDRLDPTIVKILHENSHIPSVLVLNKVDLLSHKHILLSITEGLTGTLERKDKQSQVAALTRKLRNPNLPEKVRTKFLSIIHQLKLEIETSNFTNSILEEDLECEYGNGTINSDSLDVSSSNTVRANCDDILYQGNDGSERVGVASMFGRSLVPYRHTRCWPHFGETFMISSLTGDGVESLKNYLVSCAKLSEWQYSPFELTDQPSLALVEDIVREKLFAFLQKEIPYIITQENVLWEYTDDKVLVIYQNINCKSHTQASIVIGPMGRTIKAITDEASKDIEKLLNCKIDLTLNVKSNKR